MTIFLTTPILSLCRTKNTDGFCSLSSSKKLPFLERFVDFCADNLCCQLHIHSHCPIHSSIYHVLFLRHVHGLEVSAAICIPVNVQIVWTDVDILCPSPCCHFCPDNSVYGCDVLDQESICPRWYHYHMRRVAHADV